MVPTTRAFTLLAVLAYTTTCVADVWMSNPTAGKKLFHTQWTIGTPARIKWRLTSPTSKEDVANIYLVGGDYKAYKRIKTLGEGIVLGSHKLDIPKVPNVDCMSSCAIEIWIGSGQGKGDFYSHNFTIAIHGATSNSADKATSAIGVNTQPNGPITMTSSTAKGTQPQAVNSAGSNANKGALTMVMTAVIGAAAYLL
ncbi:hypothetical protein BGX27_007019 [Mortierella sp. AM989]|nr:hypothetical protein BGX27_007019 [Mortierella sp. AM989]